MADSFMLPRQVVEHSGPDTLLEIIRGHTGESSAREVMKQIRAIGADADIDYYQVTRESGRVQRSGDASLSWHVEAIRPQQQ